MLLFEWPPSVPASGYLQCSSPAHVHQNGPAPHWALPFKAISGVWIFSAKWLSEDCEMQLLSVRLLCFSLEDKLNKSQHSFGSFLMTVTNLPLINLKYSQYLYSKHIHYELYPSFSKSRKTSQYSLGKCSCTGWYKRHVSSVDDLKQPQDICLSVSNVSSVFSF